MRIWIDLDNSPHVLFFKPIIKCLKEQGVGTVVTIRSFSQTEALAKQHHLNYTVIGKHRTRRVFATRAAETLFRAAQLAYTMKNQKPTVAVSHGSRALVLAALMLGVPSMTLYDYEFVSAGIFNKLSTRVLAPSILQDKLFDQGLSSRKFTGYPGLKEDVYVHEFRPSESVLNDLSLDPTRLIVTVRPQANWAHYHSQQSEVLFEALLNRLRGERGAQIVIVPRTDQQRVELVKKYDLTPKQFRVLDRAVDGLSLMWYSDAVFSGGGTMVREAALLGTNVYSTFAGKLGGADSYLVDRGLLKMVREPKDLRGIVLEKRTTRSLPAVRHQTRDFICDQIVNFARLNISQDRVRVTV